MALRVRRIIAVKYSEGPLYKTRLRVRWWKRFVRQHAPSRPRRELHDRAWRTQALCGTLPAKGRLAYRTVEDFTIAIGTCGVNRCAHCIDTAETKAGN